MTATTQPSAEKVTAPAARSNGRVLIVDDEPVLRAMACSMLSANGWEVLSASSAEEATQLLKYCHANQKGIDVLVIDLIMPGGMSGVDAITSLRVIQPDLRVVASSGFLIGQESCDACLDMGFDDVLPKPYTVDDLTNVVERNCTRFQTMI